MFWVQVQQQCGQGHIGASHGCTQPSASLFQHLLCHTLSFYRGHFVIITPWLVFVCQTARTCPCQLRWADQLAGGAALDATIVTQDTVSPCIEGFQKLQFLSAPDPAPAQPGDVVTWSIGALATCWCAWMLLRCMLSACISALKLEISHGFERPCM